MSGARVRVFVYGSLLAGEPNHRVLAGAALLGAATTTPTFTLYDLGAFPGLVACGEHVVAGEVYEVDAVGLAHLDRLEGHPSFYRRTPITLADGADVETYLLTRAQVAGRPVVTTGSWRVHRKERRR
ncbi:MAG: gamma-glutamylcyclotransferase [Polyangiaceae bacterium]|nr:gamma-glutamylcyclotransferase [Polyangiaceae bacterium]